MYETGQQAVALTIAGSDSGGGAGIQADLKTFASLGVYGASALTCVTAQNPDEVTAIHAIPPEIVVAQMEAVCRAFPVRAAKTGMLYSAEIIRGVAGSAAWNAIGMRVVDPVMIAASGARLLRQDAMEAMVNELIPTALLLTPNAQEAEILCGGAIESESALRDAARAIADRTGRSVVAKGGHLEEGDILNVLVHEGREILYRVPRVEAAETHGAGCAFSAAITARLAVGRPVPEAVEEAGRYVAGALAAARPAGLHRPLHFFFR